ncbi:unnamed protein product [Cylindrotheca closterium]|uniref:protein-tyrosine-phosphatase n=1 Tax=Cylindrotheca closterium TaxID=2856 RepID=A0AAD2CKP4_9STRA|nr:unnamed protein product [Cylindrotheca closterium]
MSLVYSTANGGKRNSLYIGGRSDAKSLEKLERYGISHILNVTPGKEASIQAGVPNFFEKKNLFRYRRVAVYDAPTSAPQLLEAADSVVKFISNGLHHGSVLVHCQHGVSRSTTCALFYLVRKAKMSLTDALQMIQRRRPQAQPIPAFMKILEQYAKVHGASDHDNSQKRVFQSQSSANDRKRPRVGPSTGPPTGPVGPPQTRTEIGPSSSQAHSLKEIGPSLPSDKTIGPSPPPYQQQNKEIGPSLPPRKDDISIGPSLPPAKEDESIGPSLPLTKEDK